MFDSADERPHVDPTGSEAEDAYESWIFMARFDSEDMAVAVELVWRRGRGESWYVATLRRAGHAVVAVLDDAVVLPTLNPSMEFRAEGLWAAHICEAPFEHWTIGLEAFGVGLEDPSDLVARRGVSALGSVSTWSGRQRPR